MAKQCTISAKVSGKGAVSVYGLQRFPVTLYADQWEALLERGEAIKAFIGKNKAVLTTKTETSGPVGSEAL